MFARAKRGGTLISTTRKMVLDEKRPKSDALIDGARVLGGIPSALDVRKAKNLGAFQDSM